MRLLQLSGCDNLIIPLQDFNILCRFSTDTEAELNLVKDLCVNNGAFAAVIANHWAQGGAGATDLGNAVIDACASSRRNGSPFRYVLHKRTSIYSVADCSCRFLYPLEKSLKEKIEIICREIYGSEGVEFTELAEQRIKVDFSFSFVCWLILRLI